MPQKIKKSSGELEEFSPEKLRRSLLRSGASEEIVDSIIEEINGWVYEGVPSKLIYEKAFGIFAKTSWGMQRVTGSKRPWWSSDLPATLLNTS